MGLLPASVDSDRSGRHLTAYISGELDREKRPQMGELLLTQINDDDQVVGLDLAEVTFCSSAGVGLILRLHQHVTENGGIFRLYNPAENVLHVLEMCNLGRHLAIYTDAPAAETA